MNRTIKDATVKRYFYDTHDQLRAHLQNFVNAYNFARRLKTLRGLTPYEFICKAWTSEPQRFRTQSAPANAGTKQLASELSDRSDEARTLLAKSFGTWESHLNRAFEAMVRKGELDAAVNREALATAVMGALQDGLLLAQTTRSTKPLELSLDMALSHIERHATKLRNDCSSPPELGSAGRLESVELPSDVGED